MRHEEDPADFGPGPGPCLCAAPTFAETYFPIIAKGFSHQFWQAVKAGAEEAAARNGVTITVEGPNTEAEIDKQTVILSAAIAKAPQGLGFAALDSQAQVPMLQKAADAGIPIVGFDTGVEADLPRPPAPPTTLRRLRMGWPRPSARKERSPR